MPTTPQMRLLLPTVSTTLGPQWASLLSAALALVDTHDHSYGKGVPVPASGIDISADLPFNGHDATLLRSVRLTPLAAALTATTDLGCLANIGGDLYWNNGDGTAVQLTDGTALSATSLGGISGLPSGTASASFATSTFTLRQATNQSALLDVGPVVVHDTAASALGITLQSPTGLAAAYALTLPAALPASTKFMQTTAAGLVTTAVAEDGVTLEVASNALRIKDSGVSTAKIEALAVTRPKMAAVGQQVSATCGTLGLFSTASATFVDITNLSATLTTTGRPVVVGCVSSDGLVSSDATGFAALTVVDLSGANEYQEARIGVRIDVTGSATTTIGQADLHTTVSASVEAGVSLPCSWQPASLWTIYAPAAGTYTFKAQMRQASTIGAAAVSSVSAHNMKLIAYEL